MPAITPTQLVNYSGLNDLKRLVFTSYLTGLNPDLTTYIGVGIIPGFAGTITTETIDDLKEKVYKSFLTGVVS